MTMAKNMHSMTLEQLRTTHQAGGLSGAELMAQGKGFYVVAASRTGGRVILVRHSDRQPRLFVDPGTAIKLLHDIGFGVCSVNMAAWQPNQEQVGV
jgi:hypothetical protein